jgi:hypothetical protein
MEHSAIVAVVVVVVAAPLNLLSSTISIRQARKLARPITTATTTQIKY